MRKLAYFLPFLLWVASCEDVIEVDAPTEPPRLIVDGVVRIDTSEAFTTARIRIRESSSFFEDNSPKTVQQAFIQNPDYVGSGPLDENFVLLAEVAPGVYEGTKRTSFFTAGELFLNINDGEERFLARTTFVPTVPIDTLIQGDGTLFSGNETEVKVAFTDNGDRDDFYILNFGNNEYLVTEDEFYQGQQFEFSYFYDDNIAPGMTLTVSIFGADESFYTYMDQVIVQSGGNQGPFQTPVATVRGNIFNVTGIDNINVFDNVERTDNFALGYFAVVQEFKNSLVVQ
jgi:hypothetical protein